jgi:eukaryotic-like serine/threonine-protein kinase
MGLSVKLAANWPLLSPLLDEALDLPTGQRAAWVDNLAAEHRALKTALGELLANDEASEPSPGSTIGPWRLVRKIGEGGMAKVWMAERCDGLMTPPVALKFPRTGHRNSLFCRRLARERDFLNALNHPNIARLLDVGMTFDSQPYLVLEYVEGKRIDDYCRERQLPLKARLELFLQTAQAIAFAHQSLVLHRDLKPSNILITPDGAARVLDFGIAKALEQGQTVETDLTLFSGRALTLDYASPEQITGRPLTVTSDVYSLGVVLYELVTGVRPYKLKRKSAAALEEQILETQPPPPSEVVSGKQLRHALRGDLDRVILMALRKVPEARYRTVEAFADDVERYIRKRPVVARPDRPWYRASMFIRRHPVAFINGAVFLLILVAALTLIAWQAHVAFVQKKQADEAKALVISMLFDAHSYRGVGKPLSALDLLRLTQQRLIRLPASDARTRVQILNILGASLLSQQDTKDAEAAVNRAVEAATALAPSDPERLRSHMLRGWVLLFRGHTIRILPDINRLLAEMRQYGSALPEDFAGAWRIRSAIALAEGDAATAISSALAALRIAESRLGTRHNQAVLALVDLSYAYQSDGRRELALKTADQAVKRALDAYSQSTTHPNVIKARLALGQALAGCGRLDQAIQVTHNAIQDASALFGPSSFLAGLGFEKLARIQSQAGKRQAAKQSVERSYSILKDHFQTDSPAYASLMTLRAGIEDRGSDSGARRR